MSSLLASTALFLLAVFPAAQSGSGMVFKRVSKPLRSATLESTGGMNFGAPKGGRMLLCAIDSSGFACSGAHTGVIGSVSPSSCAGIIPLELSLVNNTWCGQAVVLGPIPGDGNARLSSAISGLVGTN